MDYILQYFVFDETGNHILEANAVVCSSEQDLIDTASSMVEIYHASKDFEHLGLVLNDNTNGKVLYNSREEK